MNNPVRGRNVHILALCIATFLTRGIAQAQVPVTNDPPFYGPFNGTFLPDGDGLKKPLLKDDSILRADSPWSMYGWIQPDETSQAVMLVAGVGDPTEEFARYLAIRNCQLELQLGKDNSITGPATLPAAHWHFVAATFDGSQFRLFSEGTQIASGKLDLGTVSPALHLAPPVAAGTTGQHFGGKIAGLTMVRRALSAPEIQQLAQQPPEFSALVFEEGSPGWYLQTRGQAGYRAPQDPATLPHSKAPISKPVARSLPPASPALQTIADNQWTLATGWTLAAGPNISTNGATLSQPGYDTKVWWPATVPGTVLTTMIDRGVYSDPDYGLNNLVIPESLNKQDYWYRNEFKAPKIAEGRHLTLTFEGINYHADVWLNGQHLGDITGAFIRGIFDATNLLKPNQPNVVAVRVSPPPHPGIPHEQSIKAGPGENGGMMCLDGPTFVATEGWDWIPAVRDRDTGIWQPVTLTATANVRIGDPQIITQLPLPDTSRADVTIRVPLQNASSTQVRGTLKASFDQVTLTKDIVLDPGENTVTLAPKEFSQLAVPQPRLWWPNGYGKQELYSLQLSFSEGENESDAKTVRFGIREITYELSLLDSAGRLRRVDYSPTEASMRDQRVVDVTHQGMRAIPPADPPPPDFPPEWREWWKSWASSIQPGTESSSALHSVEDKRATPYLILKVNGVRIAARGGNWGMDDARKRVSRARLEPYFRLHHDANLNIIRNWVGQNTEQVFYDLADEYGLLVWNDFWESTENYNIEAQDPTLFLKNVHDTILRFRNHPSIAMWCGRNEGVPQPILNEGIDELVWTADGTRYYSPSSNQVNLQNSGPYKYMDPKLYFTTLNRGFSVETGTPSFSTLESFQAWIPKEDQWPVSDAWAYHDWHQGGNGDMAPFMAEMQAEFGAPASLEDFERKAQMLNYVDHRAIFEGMNAHLWAPNSGRMLWMTQPAWPSNTWQILSSDYDTQASFYAVKKACEPLHIQLDPSDYQVAIVNTTTNAAPGLKVSARIFSLDNKPLLQHDETKDAPANDVLQAFKLDLAPLLANGAVLIRLELRNSSGQVVSDNFYWLGGDHASYRRLNRLPAANLNTSASGKRAGDNTKIRVALENRGNVAALAVKLTLMNAANSARILPAYFSDNYISLLPGEHREVEIEYPSSAASSASMIAIRGWNVPSASIEIAGSR